MVGVYNQFAGEFEKIPFGDTIVDLFNKFKNIQTSKKVLDIGSGPGNLGEWISKLNYQVICVDPSQEMIKRCRNKDLTACLSTLQKFLPSTKF